MTSQSGINTVHQKKTILVSGGAGYIGSILCEALIECGEYRVVCLDRFFFGQRPISHLIEHDDFSLVDMDIRDVTIETFKGIDVVVDLAGISNDPACELDESLTTQINFEGARHLAQTAYASGVSRLVYSSSCSVYGAGLDDVLTEESPTNPISLYSETKLLVEDELQRLAKLGFCTVTLRNGTAYGLSRRMRFDLVVNVMVARAVSGQAISLVGGGDQWRPLVHVRDIAAAIMAAIDSPAEVVFGQIFNVGSNDQNYQIKQLPEIIKTVVSDLEIRSELENPDSRSYRVSFEKIRYALGVRADNTVRSAAIEIAEALLNGQVDSADIRSSTVNYYAQLLKTDPTLVHAK
jgi:nucleoside-diphosphate-sugar epimerase